MDIRENVIDISANEYLRGSVACSRSGAIGAFGGRTERLILQNFNVSSLNS
jgi:hypothetical protein